MKKLNIVEIEQEYGILKSGFEKFNSALLEQLTIILEKEGVSLGFPIQTRIKTVDSIIEKIENGRFNLKKSIRELQDVVGFRIILIFKKDVEIVTRLIEENLEIIKQYNSEEKLLDNQFGYSSQHCIVKIPISWTNVPTFKGLSDNVAEIQIRTLSQHIWAEASKELQYKQEQSVPRELLRSISRASALLETVDLEFERLLNDREKYIGQIGNVSKNQKLNVDLLASILDSKLPSVNKNSNEPYFGLLKDLENFEIITKLDLEKLIDNHLKAVLIEDKRVAQDFFKDGIGRSQDYFFAHSGLLRNMLRLHKPGLWEKIKEKEEKERNAKK